MKNILEVLCVEESSSSAINEKEDSFIYVTRFDDDAAKNFYSKFMKMQGDPTVKVIPIVISSFGGQVHSLLPMVDIIEACKKPVATVALGKAMSCGSILLAAGTKGYRYSAPNTEIMIHQVSSGVMGKLTELEHDTAWTKRLNDKLMLFLAKYAGKKDSQFFIKEMKKRGNLDWFLTSAEAKKLGMVDHVGVPSLIKKIK
jgi:ATP-dependent Clp protease protease subunit